MDLLSFNIVPRSEERREFLDYNLRSLLQRNGNMKKMSTFPWVGKIHGILRELKKEGVSCGRYGIKQWLLIHGDEGLILTQIYGASNVNIRWRKPRYIDSKIVGKKNLCGILLQHCPLPRKEPKNYFFKPITLIDVCLEIRVNILKCTVGWQKFCPLLILNNSWAGSLTRTWICFIHNFQ
jgi:hypothetical protein